MQLQFFNHPEGYVEPTPSTINSATGEIIKGQKSVKGFDTGTGETTYSSYQYVFQFKDHLGNVRLSYSDNDLNGSIYFLQDDINKCKNLAYEDFGVPVCNWNEIIEEEE